MYLITWVEKSHSENGKTLSQSVHRLDYLQRSDDFMFVFSVAVFTNAVRVLLRRLWSLQRLRRVTLKHLLCFQHHVKVGRWPGKADHHVEVACTSTTSVSPSPGLLRHMESFPHQAGQSWSQGSVFSCLESLLFLRVRNRHG